MIIRTTISRLSTFLYLIVIAAVFSHCSNDPIFVNDWDEDVYFFSKNLKENHVDLFFNLSASEFDKDIESLRKNTTVNTEEETIIELLKILSKIGDSHTQMQYSNKLTRLPFAIKWLDDGIFLTEVDINHTQYLGARILEVNNTSIEEVIENFRSIVSYENESNFKNQFIDYVRYIEFHRHFGIIDSSDQITLNFENGSSYVVTSEEMELISITSESPPLFLQDTETRYWYEELDEDNMIFIQYNSCRERLDFSFQTFTDQIVDRIENNTNITKLVLDLRHNGGGNSAIIGPLISELQKLLDSGRFNKDNIYLIIGRKTFSSAVLNTIELKEKLDIVVIGEPTGGKPNHHGEVKSFRLPNSLLSVSYSTKYFELSSSDDPTITPDVQIEYNSEHLLNEVDPILEKIKND